MNFNKTILHENERRILVVDDEKVVRHFTRTALVRNGYKVFVAESGNEAIEIFNQKEFNFSLALIDVGLPDKTGFEVAQEFQFRNPAVKIILSSGYGDDEMRKLVVQDKQFRFLAKPYSIEELLIAINGCSVSIC